MANNNHFLALLIHLQLRGAEAIRHTIKKKKKLKEGELMMIMMIVDSVLRVYE